MAEMAGYTYNYHDIDSGSHKRQRIGADDQHFWPVNEALNTDLTAHTAYDPVRDILNGDTIYPDTSCIDFPSINVNDGSLWYPDPDIQIFQQPYDFQGDDTSLSSQPYCEPTTITSSFIPSLQNSLNEPLEWNFPQDTVQREEWCPPQDIFNGEHQEFTTSMEVVPSPRIETIVICFGMVRLDHLILMSHKLTYSPYRSQTFQFIVINRVLF